MRKVAHPATFVNGALQHLLPPSGIPCGDPMANFVPKVTDDYALELREHIGKKYGHLKIKKWDVYSIVHNTDDHPRTIEVILRVLEALRRAGRPFRAPPFLLTDPSEVELIDVLRQLRGYSVPDLVTTLRTMLDLQKQQDRVKTEISGAGRSWNMHGGGGATKHRKVDEPVGRPRPPRSRSKS